MIPVFKCLLTLLFVLCLAPGSMAQKTYSGKYLKGSLEGHAIFDYYVEGGDTIYHGPFELRDHVTLAELDNTFPTFMMSGTFRDHAATGGWSIRSGQFRRSGQGVFKDNTVQFGVSGVEYFVEGRFDNGRADGMWYLFEWRMKNAQVTDTLMASRLSFRNGVPSGNFVFEKNKQHFDGRLDKNGFPEGTWNFYLTGNGQQDKQEWVFEDGALAYKMLHRKGSGVQLNFRDLTNGESRLDTLAMNEKYLDILKLQASLSDNYEVFSKRPQGHSLFLMAMDKFRQADTLFRTVAHVGVYPKIRVRARKYPYQPEELEQLNAFQTSVQQSDSLVERILTDPQVKLLRRSNADIAYYAEIIHRLNKGWLAQMDSLLYLYERGYLAYVPRDRIIERLPLPNDQALRIRVATEEDTTHRQYTLPFRHDTTSSGLRRMHTYSGDLLEGIRAISQTLDDLLKEVRQEVRLVELERELMEKYEQLQALRDSLLSREHRKLAGFDIQTSITGFLEEELHGYAAMDAGEEKVKAGESLYACMEAAERLIHTIARLPDSKASLKEAYTRVVFNPYTFTDMEELLKEPFYKAYEEMLLPALLQNLRAMDCRNLERYHANFDVLYDRMWKLLQKANTRQQERAVKRASDVHKAAEIMEIELHF